MSRALFGVVFATAVGILLLPQAGWGFEIPRLTLGVDGTNDPDQVATGIQILFLLTVLSLAPAILLMTTSFIRIVIVLSFIRQAMGVRQMPPNQVIIGLALFLTFFIMSPVLSQMNQDALQPYLDQEIGDAQAIERAVSPMREFMFNQVRQKDLQLFVDISGSDQPETREEIRTMLLVPAFMLSEIKRAFQIGFLIFVPFLVIDMVTASVLMSMGMLMLPPVIISLPFKILLFVLVDGWHLVVGSLVRSFQ
nr:flagellar type III secretion system pore protein FliP [Desulfohalobium retbaense]